MAKWRAAAWTLLALACATPGVAPAFQVLLEVDLPSGTESAVFTTTISTA
jgi:hypothetical protein